ncbi:triacylglycerol lipase [Apiospora kogelbergensis]|uniref:triacylglycerol lipase n=1 Tax=Apiospora kogelbergensis TaxID=1337665 RepID=UPI00312DFE35
MTQSTSRCLSARSISHLCRPARIAAITTRSVRPSVRQWPSPPAPHRGYSTSDDGDPRLRELGRRIQDDYAYIRDNYATPKHPIVLAHGLLGFAELKVAGPLFPAVQYWRGISEALRANGVEVFASAVPPSGSIEQRAEKLAQGIAEVAKGKSVNIIAHSMGGLDARYMISNLQPEDVDVKSLVTVASPHHGSAFADYLFDEIGSERLPSVYKLVEGAGFETGAFSQLTQKYMKDKFNPETPDDPSVRYFSYGAMVERLPFLSPFRLSHDIMKRLEGPNDGLVSVSSSQWGQYKGTLVGVSHLDLINWTNRLRWMMRKLWAGRDPHFNAIAFYLDIADMLAKEGL